MEKWTRLDKFLFIIFVILPPIIAVWWIFHKNAFDSLYQVFLLPILISGAGFSIWLAYHDTKD